MPGLAHQVIQKGAVGYETICADYVTLTLLLNS